MATPSSTLSEEIFTGDTTPSELPATSAPSGSSSTPDGSVPADTPGSSAASASTRIKDDGKVAKVKGKGKCIHKKKKVEEKEKEKEKEKVKKEQEEKERAEKEERERKEKEDQEKKEKEEKEKDKDEQESKKDKKSKRSKKSKKSKRSKKVEESSDDSDSSTDSDSSDATGSGDSDGNSSSSSSSSSSDSEVGGDEALAAAIRLILARSSKSRRRRQKEKEKKKARAKKAKKERRKARKAEKEAAGEENEEGDGTERASVLEFKRVDELWDKEIHDYKITDTVPHTKRDKYSSFIFTVRRVFDYENKYVETVIDIKSILLKDALAEIMGEVKGVSLVEDIPEIDPNMLFNFLPEFEAWVEAKSKSKEVLEPSPSKEVAPVKVEPGKQETLPLTAEEILQQIDHVKLLVEYLNTDYASIKATLFPLLAKSMITFDLLWAIMKPNTIIYTTCAGSNEPRAFKLEYAQKESSFIRGKWWSIEGKYLEYDGKDGPNIEAGAEGVGGFGWGTVMVDIDSFKGSRKVGSLACYPLEYRKDKDTMRTTLIERGRKFVSLKGMQYKTHEGMAFMKKRRQYAKVHVKGRIMIDPGTFRRINPNYLVSSIKSRNNDDEDDEANNYFDASENSSDAEGCTDCCCCGDSEGEGDGEEEGKDECEALDEEEEELKRIKFVMDDEGNYQVITKEEENKKAMKIERVTAEEGPEAELVFTDDELLTASPVVLGWAFTEKLWLEFPVSNIREIEWNEKAFDSLVLPENQKSIVKALVESHTGKNIAASTIDDIIQGKGRGLVSVLHGPPGVGKTLTAEGIAELLKRPLYCVSSGELGTNPAALEQELNKILDIAHSWGAVLLLDEADVFLERRTMADMHRNALVSIFLRLLEYFQGILFLTTNRVETFDDAFQSRIHVALRYNELGFKAKVKIWKMFLEMVRVKYGVDSPEVLTNEEIEWLAKRKLNGRQIKNSVRTAQALANNKNERLTMKHIKTVLDVAEGFENDLKGTGQLDSMNAYA